MQKLKSVNFIGILCDGSTDKGIVEQEVLYVIFADPETFKPTLAFFEVIAPPDSQDTPGLKQSIIDVFIKHSLEHLIEKIVFLSSDGASVNCGKNSGLIKLLQEDHPWICFIWCFSHRLELAIKDALKEFIEPVEESLRHLFYLYTKSSKKFRKLKNVYHILQDEFDMYGLGIKPVKSTGTRWIDHKLRAMERLVEKFGLYTQHLENVLESIRSSKDKAILQGKFNKLIDSKVLLRSAFFLDILTEAKKFSLVTQQNDINIINVVDCVQSTSNNYRQLLGKLKKSPGDVFNLLPTLKNVVETIETNEDGDAVFQGQSIKYYRREKTFIENHVVDMVERIISCFERRYCGVYSDNTKGVVNVEADAGDRILFDICRVLNCNVWPEIKEDSNLEERYSAMSIFENFTVNDIVDGFIDITNYAARYFTISKINPIEFWGKIMSLNKEKESWKGCFLILEICLCAPFSNATLERLFSHMNIVKSNIRSRLSNDSLNSTLHIRLNGISLGKFHEEFCSKCVDYWYCSKNRRINQRKRKLYQQRESGKKKKNSVLYKRNVIIQRFFFK